MDYNNNLFGEMMSSWMNATRQFQDKLQGKKTSPMQTFIEAQNKMMEAQKEMFKSMYGSFGKTNMAGFGTLEATNNLQQTWSKMLEQMQSFAQPFSVGQPFAAGTANPLQLFTQMMKSNEMYSDMYEVFQPFLATTATQMPSFEKIAQMMDSEQMRGLLDSMFGFLKTEQSKDFQEQIKTYILYLTESMGKYGDKSNIYMTQLSQIIPEMLTKEFNGVQHMNVKIYNNFKKALTPLLTMVPPSKEKDMLDVMLNVQDRFLAYLAKSQEINALIRHTATNAINKAFKKLIDTNDQKFSPILFDDLYNTWVNTAEDDMIRLFRSDSFSKLQAEMINTGGKIKSLIDRQMESVLEHLPIAPRTEIDELSKIIHELRTKVRNIEKENKTLKEELKSIQEDDTKKTTTAKKAAPRKTTARKTTAKSTKTEDNTK